MNAWSMSIVVVPTMPAKLLPTSTVGRVVDGVLGLEPIAEDDRCPPIGMMSVLRWLDPPGASTRSLS
jgi:hypothetical protein